MKHPKKPKPGPTLTFWLSYMLVFGFSFYTIVYLTRDLGFYLQFGVFVLGMIICVPITFLAVLFFVEIMKTFDKLREDD